MFENTFKRIDDILREEAGCTTELDYTEQTSWILFLKYLDDMEVERNQKAKLRGTTYQFIMADQYRWKNWAAPTKPDGSFDHQNALVGEDLIEFVNNNLFPYLKGFRERASRTDSIEYKIGAIFDEIDLHGKNLSNSDFSFGSFKNTNLKNANLSFADLRASDLTEVKSLAGSDLSNASFLLANLSGVNLTDVILEGTNFLKADLSGVDFTVTAKAPKGMIFEEANISNSNFESVNLSPTQVFTQNFENAGAKIEGGEYHPLELMIKLYDGTGFVEDVGYVGLNNIHIFSVEHHGDDVVVEFTFVNNFINLTSAENANFKNAGLWYANFYSANLTNADLTNADLSGADLRNTELNNADLSNANIQDADLSGADLSGADLSGVIYNQNTILKCLNHDICV